MEINFTEKDGNIKVVIEGNIDTEGGEKITGALNDIIALPRISHVAFDLTTVITTTSSGIGKLLRFYKHLDSIGATMEIKGISDNLYKQFKEIHLERIFHIQK